MTRAKEAPTRRAKSLTQADFENLAAFRHALRRFANFSTQAAKDAGLTTHQHQALLAIKGRRDGAMTIGALAEDLFIAPHTAAELVGRLAAAGLVDRVEDSADRRRVGLRLTQKAEDALAELTEIHLREVRILAPRLLTLFRDLDDQLG
jgi:DNA-binding MarR family transcriptional regulator